MSGQPYIVRGILQQKDAEQYSQEYLADELCLGRKPFGMPFDLFEIVVEKSGQSKPDRAHHGNQDIPVGDIGPQYG